jgi:hypothetical protein
MRRANRISPEPQSSSDAGSGNVNASTNEATAWIKVNSRRLYPTRRASKFRPENAFATEKSGPPEPFFRAATLVRK